jgi:hypothetical protein
MVLTTYDMSEADELFETVDFVHLGRLEAVGSCRKAQGRTGANAALDDVVSTCGRDMREKPTASKKTLSNRFLLIRLQVAGLRVHTTVRSGGA